MYSVSKLDTGSRLADAGQFLRFDPELPLMKLKLAAYGCLSERRQAGTAFLGDLGIVQRLEGALVVLIDHRLNRVPRARLSDQLLQLSDAGVT